MLNQKVICIKEHNPGCGLTLNKEYEIIDGKLTYDNGKQNYAKFIDLEDLNRRNLGKFKFPGRGRPRKNGWL